MPIKWGKKMKNKRIMLVLMLVGLCGQVSACQGQSGCYPPDCHPRKSRLEYEVPLRKQCAKNILRNALQKALFQALIDAAHQGDVAVLRKLIEEYVEVLPEIINRITPSGVGLLDVVLRDHAGSPQFGSLVAELFVAGIYVNDANKQALNLMRGGVDERWACDDASTFVNDATAADCGVCGALPSVDVGGDWVCPACTMYNEGGVELCDVCGGPRPGGGGGGGEDC